MFSSSVELIRTANRHDLCPYQFPRNKRFPEQGIASNEILMHEKYEKKLLNFFGVPLNFFKHSTNFLFLF